MPNIKTAISVDEPIFEQMNNLAKTLKISRSRLFSMAAQDFIERHKNIQILNSLNKVYVNSETDPIVAHMRSHHSTLVKDQW